MFLYYYCRKIYICLDVFVKKYRLNRKCYVEVDIIIVIFYWFSNVEYKCIFFERCVCMWLYVFKNIVINKMVFLYFMNFNIGLLSYIVY